MMLDSDEQLSPGEQVAYHSSVRYAIDQLGKAIYEAAAEVGVSKGIVHAAIDTGNRIRDDLGDEIVSQIRDRIYDEIERQEEIIARHQARKAAALQENEQQTNN